jgi:hypothetical protein
MMTYGSYVTSQSRLVHAPQQDYVILPPESLDVASHAALLPPESDGEPTSASGYTVRHRLARHESLFSTRASG